MAKVIEFYIPKNFPRRSMGTTQLQAGKVIEFCSQAKKLTPGRPTGWVLGWLSEATERNRAVVSE